MEDFLYRARPWAITLVAHNWPLAIYLPLILASAVRAFLRPSRPALLVLYGLALLAAAFEYQKHGTASVIATTEYLFEVKPTLRHASQLILVRALPATVYAAGLALLGLSVLLPRLSPHHRRVADTGGNADL